MRWPWARGMGGRPPWCVSRPGSRTLAGRTGSAGARLPHRAARLSAGAAARAVLACSHGASPVVRDALSVRVAAAHRRGHTAALVPRAARVPCGAAQLACPARADLVQPARGPDLLACPADAAVPSGALGRRAADLRRRAAARARPGETDVACGAAVAVVGDAGVARRVAAGPGAGARAAAHATDMTVAAARRTGATEADLIRHGAREVRADAGVVRRIAAVRRGSAGAPRTAEVPGTAARGARSPGAKDVGSRAGLRVAHTLVRTGIAAPAGARGGAGATRRTRGAARGRVRGRVQRGVGGRVDGRVDRAVGGGAVAGAVGRRFLGAVVRRGGVVAGLRPVAARAVGDRPVERAAVHVATCVAGG